MTASNVFQRLAAVATLLALTACTSAAPAAGPTSAPNPTAPPAAPAQAAQAAAAPAPASKPTTAAELATYAGPDRRQILLEGAQKEGQLMIYTSGVSEVIKPLMDAFKAKYPFLQLSLYSASNEQLIARIVEEYGAGRYDMDVLDITTDSIKVLEDAGALQKFTSPETASYPTDALDPNGYFAPTRESYVGLGYNTKLIAAQEAPKTYDDLLDPRWKGKMSLAGSSTGIRFVGNLLVTKGPEFLTKLAQQGVRVQNVSGRALADLVISGEVPLSPTIFDSHVSASKAKNAPIEWVPLEPTVVNLGAVAVASRPPHPNAGMLWADFMLSEEGQKIYQTMGYGSARPGIKSTAVPFKKRYLEHDVKDYVSAFDQWQKLLRQTFISS